MRTTNNMCAYIDLRRNKWLARDSDEKPCHCKSTRRALKREIQYLLENGINHFLIMGTAESTICFIQIAKGVEISMEGIKTHFTYVVPGIGMLETDDPKVKRVVGLCDDIAYSRSKASELSKQMSHMIEACDRIIILTDNENDEYMKVFETAFNQGLFIHQFNPYEQMAQAFIPEMLVRQCQYQPELASLQSRRDYYKMRREYYLELEHDVRLSFAFIDYDPNDCVANEDVAIELSYQQEKERDYLEYMILNELIALDNEELTRLYYYMKDEESDYTSVIIDFGYGAPITNQYRTRVLNIYHNFVSIFNPMSNSIQLYIVGEKDTPHLIVAPSID